MEQKYRIKFFLDYGSGTYFWSGNAKTKAKFGYPIKPDELPLSLESIKKVKKFLQRIF